MIKVLSIGKRYQIRCELCNSTLEYGVEDITVDTYDEIYPENDRWVICKSVRRYLKCPVCGHYISEEQLEPLQDGNSDN